MSESRKPAEFFSEGHKQAHLEALVREREGYEAQAEQCKSVNDTDGHKRYSGRAEQVAAELKRLGAKAETGSKRAETR